MSVVVNEVRKATYLDSVALMRMTLEVRQLPGVEEAGLMSATPANLAILREAGVLGPAGEAASAADLVIALRARSQAEADAAIAGARRILDARRGRVSQAAQAGFPRSIRAAVELAPDANLVLISVPGEFAAAEGMKALQRGLNVMIFSDNVPLAEEVELKQEARRRGLLVMGPDCGTAIIAGLPIAFANAVPRGDIGLIGASGTGIQEVSCLIARAGRGISHAIGTGGRDLKAEVGGVTTFAALDLLDADTATRHIVLISKPPAGAVARAVVERAGRSPKPVTLCFLGSDGLQLPPNVRLARTLAEAAEIAVGRDPPAPRNEPLAAQPGQGTICGLFSGGTLCAEAQVVMASLGLAVRSNVAVPGASPYAVAGGDPGAAHTLIDLGDDQFTRGRPHPMIEPAVRDVPLAAACSDPRIGVVLLDVVLGFGGHYDPAGHIARVLAGVPQRRPAIVASVTGTEQDLQVYSRQVGILEAAGVEVAPSNAAAAQRAVVRIGGR